MYVQLFQTNNYLKYFYYQINLFEEQWQDYLFWLFENIAAQENVIPFLSLLIAKRLSCKKNTRLPCQINKWYKIKYYVTNILIDAPKNWAISLRMNLCVRNTRVPLVRRRMWEKNRDFRVRPTCARIQRRSRGRLSNTPVRVCMFCVSVAPRVRWKKKLGRPIGRAMCVQVTFRHARFGDKW